MVLGVIAEGEGLLEGDVIMCDGMPEGRRGVEFCGGAGAVIGRGGGARCSDEDVWRPFTAWSMSDNWD